MFSGVLNSKTEMHPEKQSCWLHFKSTSNTCSISVNRANFHLCRCKHVRFSLDYIAD